MLGTDVVVPHPVRFLEGDLDHLLDARGRDDLLDDNPLVAVRLYGLETIIHPPLSRAVVRNNASGRHAQMPPGGALLHVAPQLLGARGMSQVAQGLGLDLADALAAHAKALADLLQGALAAINEPKTELEHLPHPLER